MYCRKLKNKSAPTVLRAIKSVFKVQQPRFFFTDGGREFFNDEVGKYFKSLNVTHYKVASTIKVSIVERSIRTIMTRIARVFFRQKNHKWVDVIESICNSYNNTIHGAHGFRPRDVNDKNSPTVFRRLYHDAITMKLKANRYNVNDHVRISTKKLLFKKGNLFP